MSARVGGSAAEISYCHVCVLPDVVVGCWKNQPTEASQPEGHHEPAGRGLQT